MYLQAYARFSRFHRNISKQVDSYKHGAIHTYIYIIDVDVVCALSFQLACVFYIHQNLVPHMVPKSEDTAVPHKASMRYRHAHSETAT